MRTQVWVVCEKVGKLPQRLRAIFTNEAEAKKFADALEHTKPFKAQVLPETLCEFAEEA